MNNILEGRFMTLITDNNTPDVVEVQSAYNEFKNQLILFIDSNTNYPNLFRILSELNVIVELTARGKKKCRYKTFYYTI